MKCVKNKNSGEIRRLSDDDAHEAVTHGIKSQPYEYTSKSAWRDYTRKTSTKSQAQSSD